MSHQEPSEGVTPAQKLVLFKSPLIGRSDYSANGIPTKQPTAPDMSLFGNRYDDDCPQFQKHEDASLLELFYDLFFAANYTVFCETQGVNSPDRFKAYVGYFTVLWITWLTTSLYDVRFVTDSIFERVARGIHLGVMVGFAVVAPKFKPEDQDMKTMRTFSIILMVSRLALAIEYASILWHIRKFRKQALPMLLQIGLNFVLAMIYLGTTFRFTNHNSNVYITWYVLAAVEVALTFALAYIFPVLSFQGTHLMKRMGLLTVIIVGDGIITICKSVVTIVENPDSWNAETVGVVLSSATTIYVVFLIYFDWMKNPYLPKFRQQLWTVIHYPLHLALCLFIQGFTQLVIWTKVFNVIKTIDLYGGINEDDIPVDSISDITTKIMRDIFETIVQNFFTLFTPQYIETQEAVITSLDKFSTIDDTFWVPFFDWAETGLDKDMPDAKQYQILTESLQGLGNAMTNALLETFKIDLVKEVQDYNKANNITEQTGAEFEADLANRLDARFHLIFNYTYIAAGVSLIIMVALAVMSRTTRWSKWAITRHIIFVLLGVGTSLVAIVKYNQERAEKYQTSGWMIPAITLVWVTVLFLTHVRNPPPLFFKGSKSFWSKENEPQTYNLVLPSEQQTAYKAVPYTQVTSSV
ncbi:bacterial low temperature requirement a [Fusarium sporotrichioides]|uniref:Bacterial low temperature requirement a n=1 Tax=Fusarium sporotrichioides TaxID=5514 RepID=A0A395RVE9_FUSSP|nr:bacterial low temperature requirement a [Fusarium sporotrichioides]